MGQKALRARGANLRPTAEYDDRLQKIRQSILIIAKNRS